MKRRAEDNLVIFHYPADDSPFPSLTKTSARTGFKQKIIHTSGFL